MTNSEDPDQSASEGRVYPGSAGPGVELNIWLSGDMFNA